MGRTNKHLALADRSRLRRLETAADAVRLFGGDFANTSTETLCLAHLDREGVLIALTEQSGGHDALSVAVGQIIRETCAHGTCRLVIAHNHPSGHPTPSYADRVATRRLAEVMRALGIELVDHLVFARDGVTSFRGLGLL